MRRPTRRPRQIVVLCDISGSMERQSRLLLRFIQALAATNQVRTESFVFGTRLTRVTRLLRERDRDAALPQAADPLRHGAGGPRTGPQACWAGSRGGRRGDRARRRTASSCSCGCRAPPTWLPYGDPSSASSWTPHAVLRARRGSGPTLSTRRLTRLGPGAEFNCGAGQLQNY